MNEMGNADKVLIYAFSRYICFSSYNFSREMKNRIKWF